MFRFLAFLLAFIFLVPLFRLLIGVVARAFASFVMRPSSPAAAGNPSRPAPKGSLGGVLRKDPVCGTYVSEAVALKQVEAGETLFFCSEECRRKHNAA